MGTYGNLFNILDLLPHLLDQHFKLHRNLGGGAVDGFGGQGVGFPVEFLHQKVEASADGFPAFEYRLDFTEVGLEAVQFLIDIGFLGENDDLLFEAVAVHRELEIGDPLTEFLFLRGQNTGQQFPYLGHLDANAGNSLENKVGQLGPFHGPPLHQLAHRLGEQCAGRRLSSSASTWRSSRTPGHWRISTGDAGVAVPIMVAMAAVASMYWRALASLTVMPSCSLLRASCRLQSTLPRLTALRRVSRRLISSSRRVSGMR